MAMQKSFVVKKRPNGIQRFGDSLSDTEIEARKNIENGDIGHYGSLKNQKTESFATGDGHAVPPPKPKRLSLKAFGEQIKVKNEMQIDLRILPSPSSSKQSMHYKLYPIEEVSERSTTSEITRHNSNHENIQKILQENRARAQNRPMSANRRLKMDKDFEIRKTYFTSEESEMNSAFNEKKAEEVAKVISASQNTRTETTASTSISSFKRNQILRLSHDSMQRYQSRLLRLEDDNSNLEHSCFDDNDTLLSVRTYSTAPCDTCCFGKIFKKFSKTKKN